jgi:hypothetical protein
MRFRGFLDLLSGDAMVAYPAAAIKMASRRGLWLDAI